MSVHVIGNTLPLPNERAEVEKAVQTALRDKSGDWQVLIHEPASSPSWHITIWGPSNFHWAREFFGIEEQNPLDGYSFIRNAVVSAISPPPAAPKPSLYISYAYPDNSDGFVDGLCKRLALEIQVQTGKPVDIHLDVERRRTGARWSGDIEALVRGATSFVTVISPSYFESDLCRKEFELFLARGLQADGLIFPVYFVASEEWDKGTSAWARTLRRQSICDLTKNRFGIDSKAAPTIARLAASIREALAPARSEGKESVDAFGEILPLYVESFELIDFRCFDHIEINLNRQSSLEGRWTCIAGINGAGKSSILQALGLALLGELARDLGSVRLNRMRRVLNVSDRARSIIKVKLRTLDPLERVDLHLEIIDGTVVLVGPSYPPKAQPSWHRIRPLAIAGYGATRNLTSRPDFGNEQFSVDVRRQITLFEPLAQVAGADVLLGRKPASPAFEELFHNLIQQVFEGELRSFGDSSGVQFTVSGRDAVDALDLPDGYRSAAAWLADLCAIWCEKAPALARKANPAEIQAIVLIDEIDLHLHPSLQRAIVPRLRKALPKVQWIVTTHSPLVLANFDANEIIALDRESDGNIRELDRQILGFTTDKIYQWLMGTSPMGLAIEEDLKESNEGAGRSPDEIATLMRTSPTTNGEAARKQVAEFKEILSTLKP